MSPRRPPAPRTPPPPAAGAGPGARTGGSRPSTTRPSTTKPSTTKPSNPRPSSAKTAVPGARPSSGRATRPPSSPGGSSRPRAGSAGRSAAPRSGLSAGSRRPVWVIGAVGVLLAALILPYFQKWLVQRSQIEAARASVAQSQQQVQTLNEQLQQWSDDQYVKAQARQRLHYVMPGETGYVVLPPKSGTTKTPAHQQAASVPSGNRPWYADMWVSAEVAGAADRSP